ncbi:MAG: Purine nucleoside phosphorylase DeoD-type [Phycisphaerae bacterium]|nr:Purine nucleoside phosphorylase DeoD-type [Phycisphaerae bacterium]
MGRIRSSEHTNAFPFSCQESVLLLPFGRRSFLPAILARYDHVALDVGQNTDREVYNLRIGDQSITLIYAGMGDVCTANALEKINSNGGQRVILFGACGGTVPQVRVGDIIIPAGAVRGEGTSRYYQPIEFPATMDVTLTHALMTAAHRQQIPFHHGYVFTTDASNRQGAEIYQQYDQLVVAADCECASAAVVASTLRLALSAIFFITDNITLDNPDDRKRRGLDIPLINQGFNAALDVAVNVLCCRHEINY